MKKFKIVITLIMVLCVFCSSLAVFAEPADESAEVETVVVTEAETEPVTEPATKPETEPVTEPATEPSTEPEGETQEQTEAQTTENKAPATSDDTDSRETTEKKTPVVATTRKPATTRRPTTTHRPVNNEPTNREEEREEDRNDQQVEITEEEESLPEGSFYVYLERNNGTKRLKAVLTKPELVTEPETPVREGFIFDGWYADPEFTTRWRFYSDLAVEGTVIYAKWVPDPSATVYKVTVKAVEGGTIEVNPSEASAGEPVMVLVNPDEGMRLVAGSVTVNGKPTDILSFSMPAENVVVSAKFEIVPEVEEEIVEKKTLLPFIVGGVVLLIAVGVVIFLVLRRRDDYADDEIDENGTIIDNDTDMSWVDESIIVEDGFKDGEKVVGNFIPEDDFTFEPEDEE